MLNITSKTLTQNTQLSHFITQFFAHAHLNSVQLLSAPFYAIFMLRNSPYPTKIKLNYPQ